MESILAQLEGLFASAIRAVLGADGDGVDPMIRAAGDPKFGDYQSNVAMGLAKKVGRKPRDLAQAVVDAIPANDVCEPFEIAGPGFINIRLRTNWLAAQLNAVSGQDDRLGIGALASPQTVVVDYSGPNIAKQMHVGHIRSTIIGDAIARVLAFEGHRVIRQNHIGDWGTQFGMLIAHLKEKLPEALDNPEAVHLGDLEKFYKEASARDKEDADFHERARTEVVALHNKQPDTMRAWQYIVEESRRHYLPIYQRLQVSLTRDDECGESFYADGLADLVKQLQSQFGKPAGSTGEPSITVEESDGALCVFHQDAKGEPAFKSSEDKPFPLIIRKSDGAFIYATTDLAALRYRTGELKADRIIYVTDARQALHFQMVFATARAAGWTRRAAGEVALEHVMFGTILGPDRKPLKTRSGDNIKLAELLDEAVERAEQLIRDAEADEKRRRGFTEAEIKDVAEAVGIGAVKYADLSQNRQTDYLFSWDKMLAMEGNTAPYMMYAYARIRSIYRKGEEASGEVAGDVALVEPAERALGLAILRFAEMLASVGQTLKINVLTEYLYELATAFSRFYESCSVLKADSDAQRASRLKLCDLTARTLQLGLDLLGIRVVERM